MWGEFSNEEWTALRSFSARARKLVESDGAKMGARVSARLRWTSSDGLSLRADSMLTPDQLAGFLHLMRPFILESEPTHFRKVHGILSRHLRHPVAETILEWQADRFSGRDEPFTLRIQVDGMDLSVDDLLMKWLNAEEYHGDEEKQQDLARVYEVLTREGVVALVVSRLIAKANAVFQMRGIIRQIEGNVAR